MAGRARRARAVLKRALDSLLEPAEDPRQTAFDVFQRQCVLLAQVRRVLVDVTATKNRLTEQAAEARAYMPRLEAQAREALRADREDLARLALQRRRLIAAEIDTLEEHVREIQGEEQRLSLVEHRLTTQIEAMRARQQLIAARHRAADAQVRIGEALTGASDDLADVALALERMEHDTRRLQARAAAVEALIDPDVLAMPFGGDPLERDLWEITAGRAVEDELRALKAEGGGSDAPAVGEPGA